MRRVTDFDVVIVGGGPAGSAAGIELAREGQKVAIVERTAAMHDKVCGDFLSGEAIEALEQLGVGPVTLGGLPIERLRLVGSLCRSSAALPFAAQSVARRVLDEALLESAARSGATVLRGHSAEALRCADSGWCVEVASGGARSALRARDVVVATGKHDLRGMPRPEGKQSGLVGLKMYLRLAQAQTAELARAIEIVLLQGGYGGLSLVENEVANLCFVVKRTAARSLSGGWETVAAMLREHPHLRMRLEGAEAMLARPLAINPIPYGFVRCEAIARGVWSVGDQAVVIPSFTGDGVALALHSGRLAARRLLEGADADEFQRELYGQVWRQVARATVLSRALVAQPQRTVLELTARLWPGVLRTVATQTRLKQQFRLLQGENRCATA
ncbi:MAG TPA: FAD-dependent monooxygenase [Candidatus Aquilonibacter sp.]|nr:FAD-dependent monooxygenase [Candidatus Aquilonibacter sp.]